MKMSILVSLTALVLAACAGQPNPQLAQLVNAAGQPCPDAASKAGAADGVYATSAMRSGASICRTRADWQWTQENARRREQDVRDSRVRSLRLTEARGG